MLKKKQDHFFVDCDREGCTAFLPFAYVDRDSALFDINYDKWNLQVDDKIYCPKCKKKIKV